MSKKLKFREDENDEVTEKIIETSDTVAPSESELLSDEPAADFNGGAEFPNADNFKKNNVDAVTVESTNAVVSDTPDENIIDRSSKLKHSKEEKKIGKLEKKADKYGKKRDKARGKQPTRKKKVKERFYDESKNKAKTKIRFDKEPVPMNEAKWNLPKKQSFFAKSVAAVTTAGINKLHAKVYEAEHENVGTQFAHQAELIGESAYHGGKKLIHETHQYAKNAPYRKTEKFDTKSVKANMKLNYQKTLRDNPKIKSNRSPQDMQKKKISRQYAEAVRKTKKSKETAKKSSDVVTKVTKSTVKFVRKKPIFSIVAILLLIITLAVMSLFTTCAGMGLFSNMSGVFGAACYSADDADIDNAELSYTEWETDLRIEISNAELSHPGYDEYRYNIDSIRHDPHELMAFLTAVYNDFKYDDIQSVLRELFDGQYNLEFVPETEIRTRTEIRTGIYTDDDGNEFYYEYEVEVEYEWYILNVNLTAVSLMEVILPLMNPDQTEHFFILMQTKGGRQYAGNPFTVDWIPYITSYYGYRIHPITGVKDYHKGIDISLPLGTDILSGFDGTVTTADYDDEYGNYIVINDGKGLEMKYAHCDTLLFSVGQTVRKGEVIATVGNTGDSTGAHLHMEILKDGIWINPIYFVESN